MQHFADRGEQLNLMLYVHSQWFTCGRVYVCLQEELEAQVSLLQGQINDLEAMSKYCAKMMNVHIGKSNRP